MTRSEVHPDIKNDPFISVYDVYLAPVCFAGSVMCLWAARTVYGTDPTAAIALALLGVVMLPLSGIVLLYGLLARGIVDYTPEERR